MLPPSRFCSDTRKGSQDCLESSLACPGDSSDSIGATSPRIWPTSYFFVQVFENASSACYRLPASPKYHFDESRQITSVLLLADTPEPTQVAHPTIPHSDTFRRKRDVCTAVSLLPRHEVSQKTLSDALDAGFIHSKSLTDSLKRVSTTIVEMSLFSTFRGRHATRHHECPDNHFSAQVFLFAEEARCLLTAS